MKSGIRISNPFRRKENAAQPGSGKRRRLLKTAAAVIILLLILGLIRAITYQSPEVPNITDLTAAPLQGKAEHTLTAEQINQRVMKYQTQLIWLLTADTIAQDEPERFHRILYLQHPTECIRFYHQMIANEGVVQTKEQLVECARKRMPDTDWERWQQETPTEKEARLNYGLLTMYNTLSPAERISRQIAWNRGLDATVENNEGLRDFASDYLKCQDRADLTRLQESGSARIMAQHWLETQEHIIECIHSTTHTKLELTGEE